MAQAFKETAHLSTNMDNYSSGYDNIKWNEVRYDCANRMAGYADMSVSRAFKSLISLEEKGLIYIEESGQDDK